MSGGLLPGHIDYIALGGSVDDEMLGTIISLEGLEEVEEVVAKGCGITDEGLLNLTKFPLLKRVYIGGTRVTPTGVLKFQRAMPNCWVTYDNGE
jgi:hypothetical protein